MTAPVFVDTNVLVCWRDDADQLKQRRVSAWLEVLWSTRSGRLSIQVLQEYYATVTGKLQPGIPPEVARRDVRRLLAWKPQPMDSSVLEAAWTLEERHQLSWWDALIVGAAEVSGCRYILTEDLQDGQRLDGVRILSPFVHDPATLT